MVLIIYTIKINLKYIHSSGEFPITICLISSVRCETSAFKTKCIGTKKKKLNTGYITYFIQIPSLKSNTRWLYISVFKIHVNITIKSSLFNSY